MQYFRLAVLLPLILAYATTASCDPREFEAGGDTYLSGDIVDEQINMPGDGFVSARTANLDGASGGDLHVSGFDVDVRTDVAEDLYAFGASVVIDGKTSQDLTVVGYSIRTNESAFTGGNARLFGNTLTLEGPVSGALMAMGQTIFLNSKIEGDAVVRAASISFGPNAFVAGTLTYSAESEVAVPAHVAPPERITFEPMSARNVWDDWDGMWREMPILPTFASVLFGFVVVLLFYLALGALMLSFMPRRLERMRKDIMNAPGNSILLGVIGLSMMFGMVPIIGLTIVGLPFVPVVVLGIVVLWTLGYVLGAYSVAMRIWARFGGEVDPSKVTRLLILAAAITVVALLNYIPFVGWVVNYTLVLLGIGAMTASVFQKLIGQPVHALDVDMKPIED